jgi:hypothetical protein
MRVLRNRGVPHVVHSGAFLARVVHRFRFWAPPVGRFCCASGSYNYERRAAWLGWWAVAPGEPSPWVWLRDGVDRLFHAVSVWELPPEADGPVAVCGWTVQVVSLLDEPAGGRCQACVAASAEPGGSGGEQGRHARE